MAEANGTEIGGDAQSLFADAATGDFSPNGQLLSSLQPPVVAHDWIGIRRESLSPVGAAT